MAEQDLKDLFDKYLQDRLTPEEFSRLYELVRTGYPPKELDALFESAFASPEYAARGKDHDPKEIFAELLVKMDEKGSAPVVVMRPKTTRIRWAVAASIAVCVAGGAYFFLHQQKGAEDKLASTQQEQRITNDVSPGKNKAVLTLSNGSIIILDSAHNGFVTRQGVARIIKTDSGQLAYQLTKEKPTELLYNTLTTPRGGQYELLLPDGSKAWLNAASSIKYPTAFAGGERKVEITGEVYFEVKKDPHMPFTVRAAGVDVQVLGTHFNVNAYGDEPVIRTTLLEGSVKISMGGASRVIKPGEQAIADSGAHSLSVQAADTYQAVAWQKGQFEFDKLDIPTIMRQIQRWYDIDVSYETRYPGTKLGGGISRNLNLSSVLTLLDKNGVHTKMEGRKIIVIP